MKTQNFIILIFACILFGSCGITTRVSYQKEFVAPKKVGLITTSIGPIIQPVFPLIDAALFNEGTNNIAPQIIKMQGQHINNIESLVAANLGRALHCEVIAPEALRKMQNFKAVDAILDLNQGNTTGVGLFPEFILSKNSLRPFHYNSNLTTFLKGNKEYSPVLAELCQNLGLDMLAMSYSRLNVVQAGAFGIYGSLRLDMDIFLFDKNGKLVANGFSHSYPSQIEAKDIADYAEQMGFAETVLKTLLSEFYNKFPTNQTEKH